MSREREEPGLSTADFAAAGHLRHDDLPVQAREHHDEAGYGVDPSRPQAIRPMDPMDPMEPMERMEHIESPDPMATRMQASAQPVASIPREPMQEHLAPLFMADAAQEFRSRWDAVQIGFVDDPRHAVQQADELVAQVMKSLAEGFARQRADIEADIDQTDQASTENLRVALRRYRSFFQRLLSL